MIHQNIIRLFLSITKMKPLYKNEKNIYNDNLFFTVCINYYKFDYK